jgi:glycosyltransferase involved in cell wall biosynthesis
MRIAYVIPAYPPLPSQPFVVNEMIAVQEAGHEVVVLPLYPAPGGGVRHGTFARFRPVAVLPPALCDAPTAALALWVLLRHPWRSLCTLGGLLWAASGSIWSLARVLAVTPKALAAAWRLRRLGVERLHAHFANQTADCAAIAAGVAGLPFSFTAHAYDIYSTAPRQRNATLDWKLRHAARVFTVNRYARDLLRERLTAVEQGRVCTAYVGIPTALFRPEPQPPDGDGLRLLCVARFQEKKGLDTLVDACALLRDRGVRFHLRLIGDGPQAAELRAQVQRLALEAHVELPGPMPQEEVARALRDCHVFVMPCRRDRTGDMDGIPTVFMEALATARPVVSCAVSGVPELVRDGETGLIVPPDAADALADAVARLAADPALRTRLGSAGRALVEQQHDQDRNARRVVELLAGGSDCETGTLRPGVLTALDGQPPAR